MDAERAAKMEMKKAVKAKLMKQASEPKKEYSPWIKHVMSVKSKHPEKSLKECMSLAKDSYKK